MLEIAAVRAGLAWVKSAGRAAARNLRAAAQPQVCGGSAKRSGFAKSRDCKTGRIERHEKCADSPAENRRCATTTTALPRAASTNSVCTATLPCRGKTQLRHGGKECGDAEAARSGFACDEGKAAARTRGVGNSLRYSN